MKLFLFKKMIFLTLTLLVCTSSWVQLEENIPTYSHESQVLIEKRFSNPRFALGLDLHQMRQVFKHFRELKQKDDKGDKKYRVYGNRLASKTSSSFLKYFNPMRA